MTERDLWFKCVDYCIKNEIVGFHLMFDEFIKMRDAQGFVLVPLTRETAVAIEQKVEQQLEASGITAEPHRLDGWAILDAISAVEGKDQ